MRRGQSMSFDAVAATFLFVLLAVFGAIYAFNYFAGDVSNTLSAEANTISESVVRELSVRADNTDQVQLDMDRFRSFKQRANDEYSTVKRELGITREFCVFLEDESGRIVGLINDDGTIEPAMFGSSELSFTNNTATSDDDIPCGG